MLRIYQIQLRKKTSHYLRLRYKSSFPVFQQFVKSHYLRHSTKFSSLQEAENLFPFYKIYKHETDYLQQEGVLYEIHEC